MLYLATQIDFKSVEFFLTRHKRKIRNLLKLLKPFNTTVFINVNIQEFPPVNTYCTSHLQKNILQTQAKGLRLPRL